MTQAIEAGLSFRAQSDPAALASIVAAVARHRFDTLSVYDDLGDPPPWRTLHALAAVAGDARLGAACIAVPRHPSLEAVVAEVALLSRVSSGVYLGLAPGAWMGDIGLAPASVGRMREALGVCRYLLEGRTAGFEGATYRVAADWLPGYELPAARVPLMLGAWGARMLAMGGEHADEIKIGGSAAPDAIATAKARLAPGLAAAGRDDVPIVLGAVTVVDEDGDRARLAAKRRAVTYIDVIGASDAYVGEHYGAELARINAAMARRDIDGAVAALPDELLRRFAFAGTPEEVIRHAEAVYEAGASRIEFGAPHGLDEATGIELMGWRVLPYFSSRGG